MGVDMENMVKEVNATGLTAWNRMSHIEISLPA